MEKVNSVLASMSVEFLSFSRMSEESFASEVYDVETKTGKKILKFSHSPVKFWRELKTLEYIADRLPVPGILSTIEPENKMYGALFHGENSWTTDLK